MADARHGDHGAMEPAFDEAVEQLVGQYVDRMNAGEILDREIIRQEHPALAEELLETLEVFLRVGQSDEEAPPRHPRRLYAAPPDRPRRYGRRVRGAADVRRTPRCAESTASRSRCRQEGVHAVHEGGEGRSAAQPSERRARARHGGRREHSLLRHGVRRGGNSREHPCKDQGRRTRDGDAVRREG